MRPYYEHAGISIFHEDAREMLPTLPSGSVNLVLTDPPYGVNFKGEAWDEEVPEIALRLPQMFGRVAIITGTLAAWRFPEPRWVACWARPASSSRSKVGGFSHWSPILLYGDCALSVDFKSWHAIANAYPSGFGHPSPKPLCLMKWLVEELSAPGEFVLDPFMGSGTTLLAAKQLGRRAAGVEIEERYCEIAARRLQQEVLPLFEVEAAPVDRQLVLV